MDPTRVARLRAVEELERSLRPGPTLEEVYQRKLLDQALTHRVRELLLGAAADDQLAHQVVTELRAVGRGLGDERRYLGPGGIELFRADEGIGQGGVDTAMLERLGLGKDGATR